MTDLGPGDRVDRFELLHKLGEGAQASVWQAQDSLDGALRALKLLPIDSNDDGELERVRREGRILAKLEHPTLVPCRALVEDVEHGVLAAALDWVIGDPLNEAMDDVRFSLRHREYLFLHLARAVAYLHEEGLVHRDLKMSNVMVSAAFWDAPDDPTTVKLVDFGIAVPTANPRPITQAGAIIGTVRYLPPEVVFGRRDSHPGRDVFALAIIGWCLLADAFPGPAVVKDIQDLADFYQEAEDERAPWPGDLQHRWRLALEDALVLDPDPRSSATWLVSQLEESPPRRWVATQDAATLNYEPRKNKLATTVMQGPAESPADALRPDLGEDKSRSRPAPSRLAFVVAAFVLVAAIAATLAFTAR